MAVNGFDKQPCRNYNGKVAGKVFEKVSQIKKERKAAVMDSGSSYHAETEDGRKRIPALHP